MDLNRLYFDHQIALIRAASGPLEAVKHQRETADLVAAQIACARRNSGAAEA